MLKRKFLILAIPLLLSACDLRQGMLALSDVTSGAKQWQYLCNNSAVEKKFCFYYYGLSYADAYGGFEADSLSWHPETKTLRAGSHPIDSSSINILGTKYDLSRDNSIILSDDMISDLKTARSFFVRVYEWPAGLPHEFQVPVEGMGIIPANENKASNSLPSKPNCTLPDGVSVNLTQERCISLNGKVKK